MGILEKILGAEGFFNLVVKVIIRISGRKLEPNEFVLEISDNCLSVSNYPLETTNRSGVYHLLKSSNQVWLNFSRYVLIEHKLLAQYKGKGMNITACDIQ